MPANNISDKDKLSSDKKVNTDKGNARSQIDATKAVAKKISRNPKTIESRLGILISLLEYLSVHRQATVGELSQILGLDPLTVLRDLELAACCGIKPFTPDSLLDIEIDLPYLDMDSFDGDLESVVVTADISAQFNQSVFIDFQDLMILEQLKQTLANISKFAGSGILESAIDKILLVPTNAFKIQMRPPKFSDEIDIAIDNKKLLDMSYFSKYSDTLTDKKVAPYLQKYVDGNWYLYAVDTKDNVLKTLKHERILSVSILSKTFKDSPEIKNQLISISKRAYNPSSEKAIRVVLSIPIDHKWLLEAIAFNKIVEQKKDRIIFEIFVTDRQWFSALMLSHEKIEVLEPEEFKELDLKLAKRLLKLYQ